MCIGLLKCTTILLSYLSLNTSLYFKYALTVLVALFLSVVYPVSMSLFCLGHNFIYLSGAVHKRRPHKIAPPP